MQRGNLESKMPCGYIDNYLFIVKKVYKEDKKDRKSLTDFCRNAVR